MKILIVDDHAVVRQGLRSLLEEQADMEVVGEAEDGRKAVQLARELAPHIVIMDITMPELDGLEALAQIKKRDPKAQVIMCSALGQEEYIMKAIQLGARDFIVKPFKPERISSAISRIP